MHRLIIILTFFLLGSVELKAQDSLMESKDNRLAEIEAANIISYDYYMRQDWQLLILFSEKTIKKNIDFYYLRLRLGIAYYELKKYRTALHHFEIAYNMNDSDELLKEYIFYCYVFTEQYPHALKFSKKFSAPTLQKTKMDEPSPVYFANAEGGLKFSSDENLYKTMNYVQAGAGFRLGRAVTAYAAFTGISQQMFYGTLSQQQFYVTVNLPVKRSWTISPAFHFINYTFSDLTVSSPPTPGYPPPPLPNYDGSGIVASIALNKSWKDFVLAGSIGYSTINKAKQYQHHLGLSWFPLHNNKLMINGNVILFSNDSGTTFKPVPSIGGKLYITSKTAISASYTSFGIKNFSEQNAYLVNNSDDITHERIQAGLDWNFYRNISVYGHYIYESKTETVNEKAYNFNSGIIGIKLTF